MDELDLEETKIARAKRAHELLSRVSKERDLTIRDDQYDFPWLLDLVRAWRRKNRRFRLIDSGKFEVFLLEWLGEAGADIYTSDEARTKVEELELIKKACQRGRAITAYFLHGPLRGEKEEEGEESASFSFSDLANIGRIGIYLYLSSRERKLQFSQVNELAYACRRGGSWLVYYHHGPLESSLEEIARSGAWIHISDQSLQEAEDIKLFLEIIKNSLSKRAHFVLHIEQKWDASQLRDVIEAGATILFKTPPSDYRSPLRPFEEEAGKRKLNFRAYYLFPNFLL